MPMLCARSRCSPLCPRCLPTLLPQGEVEVLGVAVAGFVPGSRSAESGLCIGDQMCAPAAPPPPSLLAGADAQGTASLG